MSSHHPRRWLPAILTLIAVTACQDHSIIVPTERSDPGIEPGPPSLGTIPMGQPEGYPTVGEIRRGYIYDPEGSPIEVVYEIHEGLAIWQGDIVIGEAGEIAQTPSELGPPTSGPLPGVVVDDNAKRWPFGVVPYTIDDADEAIVEAAIDWVEDQTPGVTLVERTSEANYVTFRDAGGCSSDIGMQGDQQFINLKVDDGESFCSTGNAAHEILHALGMYHEHTRCDRDDYVTIDYDEIEDGKEGNFYKAGAGTRTGDCSGAFDIGDYDPGSIMHYGRFFFAIDDDPTIIPKEGVDGSVMGQRFTLGPTDVETIDDLYGTNNAAPSLVLDPVALSYPEGTTVSFDASGTTDADDDDDLLTFAWSFGDGTCDGATPPFACSDDDPDHTYVDNGHFGYRVIVSDGFDESAGGGDVEITNVPPTVDVGADETLDEGEELARSGSFEDPGADTWSATVDYGDGGGAEPLSLPGKGFDLSHTYVDNGVSTLEVTVSDDDGGVGSDDAEITVNNVAPTVTPLADVIFDSGEVFQFSGTFSDPGLEDDPWAWVIDWGDGTDVSGQTSDQSEAIEASHRVCVAGDYTVTLTVTDKDGGVGSEDLDLTAAYVTMEIDVLPSTERNPIFLGRGGGRLPVAILGSAALDVRGIDLSTVALGDGSDGDTSVNQKNNGDYEVYLEDVNGDGFVDLVMMFSASGLVEDGELDESTRELVLTGFLDDGCTNLRGVDAVTPLTR